MFHTVLQVVEIALTTQIVSIKFNETFVVLKVITKNFAFIVVFRE